MPTLHIPYRPDDREISAGQRTLRTDGAKYNQYFPQPQSEDKIVFEDGEVDDTLQLMERVIHPTDRPAPSKRRVSRHHTVNLGFLVSQHSVQA